MRAHVAVGTIALVGLYAQAEGIFERVRHDLGPDAASALRAGRLSEVERMIPQSHGPMAEMLSLQGALEFLQGDMSAAVGAFDAAVKLGPLTDSDQFTLAMALVRLGADDRARDVLTTLSVKYPDRALYLYWLGRLDYYQRRYDAAIAKLRKAAELEPKSARIWDSFGLALDMQGQQEQAVEAFQTAVILNRTQPHPSAWPPHDFGFLLLRTGKLTQAEELLRESLRYDAEFWQAHYHLGRVLEKEGKESEAIGQYEAAISGDRESADACYSLAMLYRKLHRDREANAMFAEVKRRKADQEAVSSSR